MFMLVSAGNFFQLFFGWEGVGLTSYILISFWTTRVQAGRSAVKAIIVNKIGDASLLLAVGLMFFVFQSLDFGVIFPLFESVYAVQYNIVGFEVSLASLCGMLLFIG